MTMNFIVITQGTKITFLLYIAKKRSCNEQRLLGRTDDAIDGGHLSNSFLYFNISNLSGSFPKDQFNRRIFFQYIVSMSKF